ncbi:hypothetical protein [Ekhidna sp.]
MTRKTKYIIAIAALMVANLILFSTGSDDDTVSSENYFNLKDIQGISRVMFMVDEDTTKIERSEQGWTLNDEFKADEGFMNTLISVLERVEVGRTIEEWDREIMGTVEVEFDFNSRYKFQFASNANKTKSYFITEGKAKEVAVPGYRDNVVDIFTLHPDQWRDRIIIDGSWRTIQRIQIVNRLDEDFEITFQNDFFMVNGQPPVDSTAVINYLNQFQQFQANEMVSQGRFPELDSLSQLEPFAELSIDDIKNDDLVILKIYSNQQRQPFHLVVDSDGQRMVVDARRIQQILRNPDKLN